MTTHQHGLGKVGGELRLLSAQRATEDLLHHATLLGAVAVTRHVDKAAEELPVYVATHEKPGLTTLLDAIDRKHCIAQFFHIGLEQLVTRKQFQYTSELTAIVLAGIKARAFNHLRDLTAQDRDKGRVHGVDSRCVQTDKPMLTCNIARRIVDLDFDVVWIRLTMHAGAQPRLGKAQLTPAQFIGGHGVQIGMKVLRSACVALAENTEPRGRVFCHAVIRPLASDLQIFVAEESYTVLLQPVEKCQRFCTVLLVGAGIGTDRFARLLQAITHGGKIVHDQRHLAQNVTQGIVQLTQLLGAGVTADLEEQQAFVGHLPRVLRQCAQHGLQLTGGTARHQQVTTGERVNADIALVQLPAYRGRAERQVAAKYGDDRALALPAMILKVGIENAHLRLRRIPLAHEVQQAVERTVEVIDGAMTQIFCRIAGKEVVCEFVQRSPVALRRACIYTCREVLEQVFLELVPRHGAMLPRL